eukprot:2278815-Pleurochrysis_carterae.AAC.10
MHKEVTLILHVAQNGIRPPQVHTSSKQRWHSHRMSARSAHGLEPAAARPPRAVASATWDAATRSAASCLPCARRSNSRTVHA